MGRIFWGTLDLGRGRWRVGARMLCGGESGVGGDHVGGGTDSIEEDEEWKSARH